MGRKVNRMLSFLKKEMKVSELSAGHRIFLLILVSMGSSIIYSPAYLQYVFDKPLGEALVASGASDAANIQTNMGLLLAAYSWTALICYLPSGIVADRIRVRTLGWVGFVLTALLTFAYAAFPSFTLLLAIFVAMGITTILIWWGIRFKLVRLISAEEEYSRNIGLSYGIYGAAGLVMGLFNTWLVGYLGSTGVVPMRALLSVLGGVILVLGILSFLFIPKFEGELTSGGEGGFDVKSLGRVLSNPVVWLSALTLFFVYFYYTGVNQTTGYMNKVMHADENVVNVMGVIRTYGVTLLSGPIFGFLALKAKSPSKVIVVGSLAVAAGIASFVFMPADPTKAVLAAVIVILLGFLANGTFGVVSSQLTEGKVPLSVFGTATGLLSVVGFLPDTFSYIWFGAIRDANPDNQQAAFDQIFWILSGSAVIAAVCAAALIVVIARQKAAGKIEA